MIPPFDPERSAARVVDHYAQRFGVSDDSAHRFFPGAGCSANVFRYPPNEKREVYSYGAAHAHASMVLAHEHGVAHAEQYFAVAREAHDVFYDLTAVCATHACGNGARVDEWGVVPLAQEIPGTRGMTALLAAPAIFEGDAFEYLTVDGLHLRFLWVVPIFASEADFRKRSGAEALQRALFTKGVDLADFSRLPVV
ncbi:MAG TPA: suppressor of fused domain protein [Candidatus Eremiobacteraceae bacterium]|nr:suppressor of fused domain protein [Candidatus Eremiobacteraceae bacterium]